MTKQAIVCVDDETDVLKSLKEDLKEVFGKTYKIEIAEGGEEALELVEELLDNKYEIPLIISDYIMPDMKGDELLRRVHELSPKTLKVMLTGQATIEGVANAIKYAKLYRYLAKPWQQEDLKLTVIEAVNSYIQDKKIADQNAQLQLANQQLAALNSQQAELIAEQEKFTEKLFQLNQAFSRFVPRQFLQFLDKQSILDVQLGDRVQQEMSVLFSDIRDFTALSESMTPQDNFKFINAYLERIEPAIVEHQGFIDKYIGDAIMALFGGSADDAVKAGIAMLQRLADYNQYRVKCDRIPIRIGIGINTGSLMLGTVGGPNRMDSTVISDAVNLASRIESLTKNFEVPMLITHQTFLQLNEPLYAMRPIARVKVKGKSELVTVYEVFETDPPESRDLKLATFQIFLEALHNYNLGFFREAEQLFADCLRDNPVDLVSQIYLQRCKLPYIV